MDKFLTQDATETVPESSSTAGNLQHSSFIPVGRITYLNIERTYKDSECHVLILCYVQGQKKH